MWRERWIFSANNICRCGFLRPLEAKILPTNVVLPFLHPHIPTSQEQSAVQYLFVWARRGCSSLFAVNV
eukprot:scaffold6464_cov128-Skeletonema_marinoi.AAC.2